MKSASSAKNPAQATLSPSFQAASSPLTRSRKLCSSLTVIGSYPPTTTQRLERHQNISNQHDSSARIYPNAVDECNRDVSSTANCEFSRRPPTLRLDFACFEKS